jgi:predicted permease
MHMGRIRHAIARLKTLVRRNRLDSELAEEIALHVELRRQALIEEGVPPRDAEIEARRRFGNVLAIREETRDMWGFPTLDSLLQDARYGLRMLRRSPTFTTIAILSLAIGIGATVAVFSLADTVLFRKLPVRNPDELVIARWISGPVLPFDSLSGNARQGDTENSSTSFSLTAFKTLREQAAAQADVIGFAELYRVTLGSGTQVELAGGQAVSGNFFDVLGVPPAAGRPITDQDDRPGADAVAMLSHAAWQRRFRGDPGIVGQTIAINSIPVTIVGVTPRGFHGTLQVSNAPDVFVPLALQARLERSTEHDNPNFWWVLLAARLKPGGTKEAAQTTFDTVVKQTIVINRPALAVQDLPRVELDPGNRGQVETRAGTREPLQIMALVVAAVLLVACSNIANLLLARASARTHEVAVRVAIGAPRRRIVRQLLTESVVLAVLAGASGLLMATWLAQSLIPALDQGDEFAIDITLNGQIVLFTMSIALGSSVLFGLFPALRGTDLKPAASLRDAGRGQLGGGRGVAAGGILVCAQVALSLLLISAAGLLVQSVRNLERVDLGFDPSNILLFRIDPTLNGYEGDRLRTLATSILDRMRAVPGVMSASVSSHTLVANSSSISQAYPTGSASQDPPPTSATGERSRRPLVWRQNVDDQFFRTMRIPVLKGRPFRDSESPTGQPVAIVNKIFAEQIFKTDDPIGRRFKLSGRPDAPEFEIVGLAADAVYTDVRSAIPPTVYLSYLQQPVNAMTFEIKTASDPLALVPSIRHAMTEVDANVPLFDIRTQSMQVRHSLRRERLFARLATMLGTIALLLSAIGLYGLMAAAVTRRTAEIGIRMALGAERRTVGWMVLRQSMLLVAVGVAIGVPAALMSTHMVESLLFGLSPSDPAVLASAALILTIVSAVAAYVPARRAARVDPVVALRNG